MSACGGMYAPHIGLLLWEPIFNMSVPQQTAEAIGGMHWQICCAVDASQQSASLDRKSPNASCSSVCMHAVDCVTHVALKMKQMQGHAPSLR